MKIEITLGKPAKKEHRGPRSRFAATVKVDGKAFGDEYVGETEEAALTSMCSHFPVAELLAFSKAIKAEKAKADKPGGDK